MNIFSIAKKVVPVVALALVLSGCLVSGTFIVKETFDGFDFTTSTGFYRYDIDLTENDIWQDHAEKIDAVKVVGFEIWMTNNTASANTFNVYLDSRDNAALDSEAAVTASTTAFQVLKDIPIDAGVGTVTHITYAQSFQYLANLDKLKELAKTGMAWYYGFDASTGTNAYTVDSICVILTLNAGI